MKKLLLSSLISCSVLGYAGGFRVSLQGVKQLAQAHTSAHTEDAGIAFFNPAGISFIGPKLSVAMGGFGVKSQFTYQNKDTRESFQTKNPTATPLYAAITYKATDKIALGLSMTTPYGSHLVWGDKWDNKDIVEELNLKAIFVQPMVSFRLAPWASVGVSYIYAKGMLNWERGATQLGGSVNLNDQNASGHGFGYGFYFKPTSKLDISIAYRSAVVINSTKGTASFQVSPSLYPNLGVGNSGKDGFSAKLPLVDESTIGASYLVTPKWSVSADFNYYGWSRYEQLVLTFDNAKVSPGVDPRKSSSPKNFKNSKSFRIGSQYMISKIVAARIGYYYDESPYADNHFSPETPSLNNNTATSGIGLNLGKIGVDISASYSFLQHRNISNDFYGISNAQLKGKAYNIGLGISYNPF